MDLSHNIYKGSESYDASSKQAVDPSYWIYQNRKIFEHYPKQNFNFYVDKYFKIPKVGRKCPNVQILPTPYPKSILSFKYLTKIKIFYIM